MSQITLVGEILARPKARFVFASPCQAAPTCPIAKPCQNLTLGRTYEVVSVRPAHHTTCTEHEGGVQAVSVQEVPIVASLAAGKLRGTLAKWEAPECRFRGCGNWSTCFNPALRTGAEYRIESVGEALVCPMGHELRRVTASENLGA